MRTPGHDLELVLGLLFVEGLIRDARGRRRGRRSRRPGCRRMRRRFRSAPCPRRRTWSSCASCEPRAKDDRVGWQRNLVASSACGICGAAALDALRDDLTPLPPGPTFAPAAISGMAPALRAAQATFELTGGLHAAGALRHRGPARSHIREDVGRHNAVDKLVGRALLAGELPLHERALMLSGRASFELAHKAVAAGIPLMAAVSAPSSLAVHVAHTFDLTLVGFLRGERFNIYAGGERIAAPG